MSGNSSDRLRVREDLEALSGSTLLRDGETDPLKVDVRRLVGNISSAFNPLAGPGSGLDFRVSPARDGHVFVSVALPEGMTRAFVALLESLHGLVKVIDNKSTASFAQSRAVDLDEVENRQRYGEAYREEVCAVFDKLTAAGVDRREAVKRTNRELKKRNHPWASFDLVQETLRSAGRLRSRGRNGRTPAK